MYAGRVWYQGEWNAQTEAVRSASWAVVVAVYMTVLIFAVGLTPVLPVI